MGSAAKAWANGYFARSVVPVKDLNGITVLDHDEFIRPGTTVQSLAGAPRAAVHMYNATAPLFRRVVFGVDAAECKAMAVEGRSMFTVAMGLVGVLAVSGLIEAFVTPSGLPTWARIGIGVIAWSAFLAYIAILGRRAVAAGETGDVRAELAGDAAPVAG